MKYVFVINFNWYNKYFICSMAESLTETTIVYRYCLWFWRLFFFSDDGIHLVRKSSNRSKYWSTKTLHQTLKSESFFVVNSCFYSPVMEWMVIRGHIHKSLSIQCWKPFYSLSLFTGHSTIHTGHDAPVIYNYETKKGIQQWFFFNNSELKKNDMGRP